MMVLKVIEIVNIPLKGQICHWKHLLGHSLKNKIHNNIQNNIVNFFYCLFKGTSLILPSFLKFLSPRLLIRDWKREHYSTEEIKLFT